MGRAAPVFRASARSAIPPAPASQTCSGADVPKPSCVPQTTDAAMSPSSAGTPRRKKAAKLTTTSANISASVATIPASPAAAIVVPLVVDESVVTIGAYATALAGSPFDRLAEPITSFQEGRPAFDVTAAARLAGAAARS